MKVVCPTAGYHAHQSWCYQNKVTTTDNHELRKELPTYERHFDDTYDARQFRHDFLLRG